MSAGRQMEPSEWHAYKPCFSPSSSAAYSETRSTEQREHKHPNSPAGWKSLGYVGKPRYQENPEVQNLFRLNSAHWGLPGCAVRHA